MTGGISDAQHGAQPGRGPLGERKVAEQVHVLE